MRWRKRDEAVSDELVRDRQRERLQIMTALVQAQERRDEVLAVVASASSDDEAQEAVARLLELHQPGQAAAVLDMQLRRMTREQRERVRVEHDELRAAVDDHR